MALFTDGYIVKIADLTAEESEISDVADAQSIDLNVAIDNAQQEVAQKVLAMGRRFQGRIEPVWMPYDYGVQSPYTESSERPRFSLTQVVTTDGDFPLIATSIKRYAIAHTLFLVYRNAARRMKENDRYATARDEWKQERDLIYHPRMKSDGVPIVILPLPRPASLLEPNSGSWSVTPATGGTLSADTSIDIAITYQDERADANNESAPSDIVTVSLTAGQQLAFDISKLNPPNGTFRPSAVARMPVKTLSATNWNIYAAVTGSPLYLQTTLPIAQKTFTLDPSILSVYIAMGNGQWANQYIVETEDLMFRG